jgi:hypothetical protein
MIDMVGNVIAALALASSIGGILLAWRSYRASEASAEAALDSAKAAEQSVVLAKAEHHQARTPRFRLALPPREVDFRSLAKLILLGPEDLSAVELEVGGMRHKLDENLGPPFQIYETNSGKEPSHPANLGPMRVGDYVEISVFSPLGAPNAEWFRVNCLGLDQIEEWTVAIEPTRT